MSVDIKIMKFIYTRKERVISLSTIITFIKGDKKKCITNKIMNQIP